MNNEVQLAANKMNNPVWRINNLYWIQDKLGRKIKFKLNWAQQELHDNMWYCNVILKARQLGISTFICILFLDCCLFNSNMSAGIIAHTKEDAQQLFRKVKFAYDSLPNEIRQLIKADNDTAEMLKFSNNSSIRIGTSLRSSTFQYLHISEFGKICAKYPEKAQEIVTGSLNTVAAGQYIFIESTAEGRDGYFYDICKNAQAMKNKDLSELDFRFHFFPWWKDPGYRTESNISISQELEEYFDHLINMGIDLNHDQKCWYAIKQVIQGENMRREYPSTPDESWEVSNEGFYYGKKMSIVRAENRICKIPYEEDLPVHTAWDLGYNDSNAIWFFQVVNKEIRLIEYLEGSTETFSHWLGIVKSKDYVYGKHVAPHDINVTEYSEGTNRLAFARKMGIHMSVVKKESDIIPGIDAVRNMLNKCWFDEKKCTQGIKCLENYKKEWNEKHSCWNSKPLHNWASHGADAFRTLATGLYFITGQPTAMDIKNQQIAQQQWMKNRYETRR